MSKPNEPPLAEGSASAPTDTARKQTDLKKRIDFLRHEGIHLVKSKNLNFVDNKRLLDDDCNLWLALVDDLVCRNLPDAQSVAARLERVRSPWHRFWAGMDCQQRILNRLWLLDYLDACAPEAPQPSVPQAEANQETIAKIRTALEEPQIRKEVDALIINQMMNSSILRTATALLGAIALFAVVFGGFGILKIHDYEVDLGNMTEVALDKALNDIVAKGAEINDTLTYSYTVALNELAELQSTQVQSISTTAEKAQKAVTQHGIEAGNKITRAVPAMLRELTALKTTQREALTVTASSQITDIVGTSEAAQRAISDTQQASIDAIERQAVAAQSAITDALASTLHTADLPARMERIEQRFVVWGMDVLCLAPIGLGILVAALFLLQGIFLQWFYVRRSK